jgi:putative toxin-antitoxin system antitoxin component (TIGR02293 family)
MAVVLATPPAAALTGAAQAAFPAPLAWYEAPLEERMALLRRGVPARWLRELASAMDLGRTTLCEQLGLKLSTVNRKLQHHLLLSPDESEQLMGLQRLIGQAEALVRDCGDPEGFEASRWLAGWLQQPQASLGGACPARYLDTVDGREQLSRLIGAQGSGSYL